MGVIQNDPHIMEVALPPSTSDAQVFFYVKGFTITSGSLVMLTTKIAQNCKKDLPLIF